MKQLLEPLTDQQADFRYAPGKWSIKETLGHVNDTERVFSYRILRIARGDQTPLAGFEQDDYVKVSNASSRKLSDLLEEFTAIRHATIALIRSLDDASWLRRGVASGKEVRRFGKPRPDNLAEIMRGELRKGSNDMQAMNTIIEAGGIFAGDVASVTLSANRKTLAVIRWDAIRWLGEANRGAAFDLVLVDPPYAETETLARVLALLGAPDAPLTPDARVVAKHFWRDRPPERVGMLAIERDRRFGETALTFYRRTEVAEPR